MLLLTSILRSLLVICLFFSWAQAYSIDKSTCSSYPKGTESLVQNTMGRISQALSFVHDGIQNPIEELDNTNEILYKKPTENSFAKLSEQALHLLSRWDWRHRNQPSDSLYFYCKGSAFKPASDSAGSKWIVAKLPHGTGAAEYDGPSYLDKDTRPATHIACAAGAMTEYMYSDKLLAIILCPPMILEISRGYTDTQPIHNEQRLEEYMNADHFLLNVFRSLYQYAFPQHTTSMMDATTGWIESEGLKHDQALTSFYSFAYCVMAKYFTTAVPHSAFLGGLWFDPPAWAASKALMRDCELMDEF
ncbi:hypothetical protein BDV95DRAFT_556340 [Massariosphaeria phaeospora]|uniref:Uncharacterized protein n=1 Tax=Massariosphaeria phaeospora TaxID=100035 RepID=A0A7C8IJA7_9PLEO|nr:hypothetical protein BDV95DRAFT_556340 [Massariosphaeria phaeospora]